MNWISQELVAYIRAVRSNEKLTRVSPRCDSREENFSVRPVHGEESESKREVKNIQVKEDGSTEFHVVGDELGSKEIEFGSSAREAHAPVLWCRGKFVSLQSHDKEMSSSSASNPPQQQVFNSKYLNASRRKKSRTPVNEWKERCFPATE